MRRYTLRVIKRNTDQNLKTDEILRDSRIYDTKEFDSLEDLEKYVLQTYSETFRRLSARRRSLTFESEFGIKLRSKISRNSDKQIESLKFQLVHEEVLNSSKYEFYVAIDEIDDIEVDDIEENEANITKTYVVTDVSIDEDYDAIAQESYTDLGDVLTYLFSTLEEVKQHLQQHDRSIAGYSLDTSESNFYQSKEVLSYSIGLHSEHRVFLQIIKTKKKG